MWSDIQMKLVVRGWMKECRFSFSEVVSPYRYTPRALFPSVKWSPPTDTLPEPYFLQWSGPPYRYTLRALFPSVKWSSLQIHSQSLFFFNEVVSPRSILSVPFSFSEVVLPRSTPLRAVLQKWSPLRVYSENRFPKRMVWWKL